MTKSRPGFNGCALPSRDHKKPAVVAGVDLADVLYRLTELGHRRFIVDHSSMGDFCVKLLDTGGSDWLTETEYQEMIRDGHVSA